MDQGPFPPPALPGFSGTTAPSATRSGPIRLLTELRLESRAPPDRVSRVAPLSLVHACRHHYPGELVPKLRSSIRNVGSLPRYSGGSTLALPFSRPARCSLHVTACMLAEPLKRPFYTGGFERFITSTLAPVATGWSDSCRAGLSPAE